jgi:hypothetical protein
MLRRKLEQRLNRSKFDLNDLKEKILEWSFSWAEGKEEQWQKNTRHTVTSFSDSNSPHSRAERKQQTIVKVSM